LTVHARSVHRDPKDAVASGRILTDDAIMIVASANAPDAGATVRALAKKAIALLADAVNAGAVLGLTVHARSVYRDPKDAVASGRILTDDAIMIVRCADAAHTSASALAGA
jgi:hypothetical protein